MAKQSFTSPALAVSNIQLVSPAGNSPLHIMTDWFLQEPCFATNSEVTSDYASNEPKPCSLAIEASLFGGTPAIRCHELLMRWCEALVGKNLAAPEKVVLLCPYNLSNALEEITRWHISDIVWHASVEAAITELRHSMTNVLLITLDSLINWPEFALLNSDLHHEDNPTGTIASEGLTAIWFEHLGLQPTASNIVSQPSSHALIDLIPTGEFAPSAVLSNASAKHLRQVYQFTHLDSVTDRTGLEPEVVWQNPLAQPQMLATIQDTLGDSGLNDCGLLIAFIATSQQFNLGATFQHLLFWHKETTWFWPNLQLSHLAKESTHE